jgi:hypothetical protein
LSYHATIAECRALAEDYRRFDSKALNATGLRRWSATAVSGPTREALIVSAWRP